MVADPVNVLFCLIGIFLFPRLTLCVILWLLGHEVPGLLALFFAATTSVEEVVKTKIVDAVTGQVIEEKVEEKES